MVCVWLEVQWQSWVWQVPHLGEAAPVPECACTTQFTPIACTLFLLSCTVAADNFVEDVHGGFQCEVQKPYVLYRNRANEVRFSLSLCGCYVWLDCQAWQEPTPGWGDAP